MATNIGPKIGVDGEAEFRKQIANISQQLKTLGSEMKVITSEFAENDDAQAALQRTTKNLTDSIAAQQTKVDLLSDMWKKSADALGENDTKTLKYKQLLNEATAELNSMQTELKQSTEGIDKMADEAEESSSKFDGFTSAIGAIGKGLGAITAAAGTAAVAMAKTVVQSFGELEQNLGGSEAVFVDYAEEIQRVGEEAYKNLGVSQSEYLATANKMGALFQGSGLEVSESFDLTTQAMQRAADMASVMGIDMSVAMESVAGAAKGNFTMMDNLGVAMNATNIEAWALANGIDFVWKEASQADKARVAMQMFLESTTQYAGNFAREATQTVSGSLGLLQAATESFVAGLGNADADMQNLTQNMVDAFGSVVQNVTPILENIVAAIPQATNEVLTHIGSILPTLLDTVVSLFQSVLQTLLQLLPELIPAATDAVMTIVGTLIDNLPLIIDAAVRIITSIVQGIAQSLPELIPAAYDAMLTVVDTLIENLDLIIDAAIEIIMAMTEGLIDALPILIERAPEIIMKLVNALIENLPKLIDMGAKLVQALIDGLVQMLPMLLAQIPSLLTQMITAFLTGLPQFLEAGASLIRSLLEGIFTIIPAVITALGTFAVDIYNEFKGKLGDFKEIGKNLIEGLWKGIKEAGSWIWESIKGFGNDVVGAFKDVFGIHSPSTVLADSVGKYMAQGIGMGFEDEMGAVADEMADAVPTPEVDLDLEGMTSNIGEFTALTDALGNNIDQIVTIAPQLMQALADGFTSGLPELAPAAEKAVETMAETMSENVERFEETAYTMIVTFGDAFLAALPELEMRAPQIVITVDNTIRANFQKIVQAGIALIRELWRGMNNTLPELRANISMLISDAASVIRGNEGEFYDMGAMLIEGLWDGIQGQADWLMDAISDYCNDIIREFQEDFGIASPSKVFRDEVGRYMAQGIGEGFEREMRSVSAQMTKSVQTPDVTFGNIAAGMVNGIQTAMTGAGNALDRITIEVPFIVDGKELYRHTINDLRAVERANPVVGARQ